MILEDAKEPFHFGVPLQYKCDTLCQARFDDAMTTSQATGDSGNQQNVQSTLTLKVQKGIKGCIVSASSTDFTYVSTEAHISRHQQHQYSISVPANYNRLPVFALENTPL